MAALIACAAFIIGGSARLSDALLWRVEAWQSAPTVSQRIFERRTIAHQLSLDRLVPPGSLLFFGDSHLQALPVGGLAQAYNFAIGGETAQRLNERLDRYASLSSARAVVIGAGTNDLIEGREPGQVAQAWRNVLDRMPPSAHVVCVGVPFAHGRPDDAGPYAQVNEHVASLCAQRGYPVVPVVAGAGTFAGVALTDGVHLDGPGSLLLLQAIKDVLEKKPHD